MNTREHRVTASFRDVKMVELTMFGGLEVRVVHDDAAHILALQPRRAAVLVYLALQPPGSWLARESLLPLFWPESGTAHARTSLRNALHHLRTDLGRDLVVSRGSEQLALVTDDVACDVWAFERAIARGSQTAALELYRGVFLEGFYAADVPDFDRWIEQKRDEYQRRAASAALVVMQQHVEHGAAAEACAVARRASLLWPYDEQLLRESMMVMSRAGDVAGAIRLFNDSARRLERELELQPSAETLALLAALRTQPRAADAVVPRVVARVDVNRPKPKPTHAKRRTLAFGAAAFVLLVASTGVGMKLRAGSESGSESAVATAQAAVERGDAENGAGRYESALEAYRRAVAQDTLFARAWYRVSTTAEWLGEAALANTAADRAHALRGRLRPYERELLAAWRAYLHGDYAPALVAYERFVNKHPQNAEAWLRLAEIRFHWGAQLGTEEGAAAAAYKRLLALQQHHSAAQLHLLRSAARVQDAEAVRIAEHLIRSDIGATDHLEARTLLALIKPGAVDLATLLRELAAERAYGDIARRMPAYARDLQHALQLLAPLTQASVPAAERVQAQLHAMMTEIGNGLPGRSLERLPAIQAINAPRSAEFRAALATLPFLPADVRMLRSSDAELAPYEPANAFMGATAGDLLAPGIYPARVLLLRGLIRVRLNDHAGAAEYADRLRAHAGRTAMDRDYANDFAALLTASSALAQNRAADALVALGAPRVEASRMIPSITSYPKALERYLRAEAHRGAGQLHDALRWYATFPDPSGYDVAYLAPTHAARAAIYEQLGDTAAELRHLQRFVELWPLPEPDLRTRVAEAQQRIDQLAAVAPNRR